VDYVKATKTSQPLLSPITANVLFNSDRNYYLINSTLLETHVIQS